MLVTGADLVFEKSTIGLLQPKSNSVTATVFAEFFSIADGTENTRGDVRSLFLRPEVRVRRGTSWRKWFLDQGMDVKIFHGANSPHDRPGKAAKRAGFLELELFVAPKRCVYAGRGQAGEKKMPYSSSQVAQQGRGRDAVAGRGEVGPAPPT